MSGTISRSDSDDILSMNGDVGIFLEFAAEYVDEGGMGEEQIDVYPGDAAFIDKDEAVSLTNPGSQDAQVFVAAGPASFVRTVLAWAAVDAATEDTSAREDARDEDAEPVAEAS